MEKKIVRCKAVRDLQTVELPYAPGGMRYRVSKNEALCILDGFTGFDGIQYEGCHVIDTAPMMYLRNEQLYTAPHIASIVRNEIMYSAAHVALQSLENMTMFLDYVWCTIGHPPRIWIHRAIYEECIRHVHTTNNA